jgi:16S rRNA (guanine527-N7)-methyltransferase
LPDQSLGEKLADARQVLITGSKILGVVLSSDQVDRFLSYLATLLQWNDTFNLTSISDPVAVVRLHFLDSLAIAPFVDTSGPILDVGSGAGFPGMPLKIIFPDVALTLVEPRRKRANFLRALIRQLQAKAINVIEGRVEDLSQQLAGSFSTVALRAVGNLEFLLPIIRPLLQPGGKCLIMHGPKGNAYFGSLRTLALQKGFADTRIHGYVIPLGNESRSLLVLSG